MSEIQFKMFRRAYEVEPDFENALKVNELKKNNVFNHNANTLSEKIDSMKDTYDKKLIVDDDEHNNDNLINSLSVNRLDKLEEMSCISKFSRRSRRSNARRKVTVNNNPVILNKETDDGYDKIIKRPIENKTDKFNINTSIKTQFNADGIILVNSNFNPYDIENMIKNYPNFKTLKILNLDSNYIGDIMISETILILKEFSQIQHLGLNNTGLGRNSCECLMDLF